MNLQCGAYFAPACDCMFLATDLSVMHLSPRRGVKSVPKVLVWSWTVGVILSDVTKSLRFMCREPATDASVTVCVFG